MEQGSMKEEKLKIKIFTFLVIFIVVTTVIICIAIYTYNIYKIKDNISSNNERFDALDVNVYSEKKPENKPSISGTQNIKYENGVKTNISDNLNKDRISGDYSFKNISLKSDTNGTTFTASITCLSKRQTSEKYVEIRLFNNEGKFVSILSGYIPKLDLGESVDVVYKSTSDLSNAYDMEIIIKDKI